MVTDMRNYWLRRSWKLNFTLIEPPIDYFYGTRIKIEYGPYSTEFDCDGIHDIRMFCNIDPCIELTNLIVADLEHNELPEKQMVDYEYDKSFTSSYYGSKRVALTVRQKWKILKLIRGLREGQKPATLLSA
jgi:hypothetical protein